MIYHEYTKDFKHNETDLTKVTERVSLELNMLVDAFVRKCIHKFLPDHILQLFTEANAEIPKLDLRFTIHSPNMKDLEVLLRGNIIGSARFTTKKVPYAMSPNVLHTSGASAIINEISNIKI